MTMDQITGAAISGDADIAQSIGRILTTPMGSRVMRRDFGSRLFDLQDVPLTRKTMILWVAATAGAIRRWEDRVLIERVSVAQADQPGRVLIHITGHRTDIPGHPPISLKIPL